MFDWLVEAGMLDQLPRYGLEFKVPTKSVINREREEAGERFCEPAQIHWLIGNAGETFRTMTLLGINAAFGPADLAFLEFRHLALDGGWVTMPRRKTGVKRKAKLWPQTAAAILRYMGIRPKPHNPSLGQRVFLTCTGRSWAKSSTRSDVPQCFREQALAKASFYRPGPAHQRASTERGVNNADDRSPRCKQRACLMIPCRNDWKHYVRRSLGVVVDRLLSNHVRRFQADVVGARVEVA